MSFGGDEGSEVGFSTARGRDWPSVRQFNVFVENRLGNFLNVIRRFETSDNRIVSLTVVDSADCAIIRLVVRDPERALEVLQAAGLPVAESNLLVVQIPDGPMPRPARAGIRIQDILICDSPGEVRSFRCLSDQINPTRPRPSPTRWVSRRMRRSVSSRRISRLRRGWA